MDSYKNKLPNVISHLTVWFQAVMCTVVRSSMLTAAKGYSYVSSSVCSANKIISIDSVLESMGRGLH